MADRLFADRYKIIGLAAEGGMSLVYKAEDTRTGNVVALKVMRKELKGNTEYSRAFRKEANMTMRLRHENIVHTFDSGAVAGRRYIAMDYIDGSNLKDRLERERLSLTECVNIAQKLCSALSYAHHKGVIHKDLKPQNVLIANNGEPMLSDFGIAEETEFQQDCNKKVFGSVHYFSPEQARGDTVDSRTDIYSLGVMLYEMATGRLPFDGGDELSIALMHVQSKVDEPMKINRAIPPSLNKIILKAMSKDRENRYQDAAEMQKDLSRCLSEPVGDYVRVNKKQSKPHAVKRERKRSVSRAFVLALVLVILIGGIVAGILFVKDSIGGGAARQDAYMPYIVDKSLEEAEALLKDTGAEIIVEEVNSPDTTPGTLVAQSPESGSRIGSGDKVKITVSADNVTPRMPNLIGKTFSAAQDELYLQGIRDFDVKYVSCPAGDEGKVTAQYPAAGTELNEDDVKVELQVGKNVSSD